MNAAVIVLSWNGAAMLPACLRSLRDQQDGPPEVLVVDNGSIDGSPALAREYFPSFGLLENGRNLGFAGGMNAGLRALMRRARPPELIVLLNQDTVVAPDWLLKITAPFARDERIGAVGCKIYHPDGQTLQHAGARLDPGRAVARLIGYGERDQGQHDRPQDMPYVTGAALALRRTALAQVGLLDEGYNPAFYEEVDLCWRFWRAGYRVFYTPAATLRHLESSSMPDPVWRGALYNRNRLRFVVKTYPFERIRNDFLLAERVFLAVHGSGVEGRALRRAYLEGIARRAEWLRAREQLYPVTPAERHVLDRLCATLRRDLAAFAREREVV